MSLRNRFCLTALSREECPAERCMWMRRLLIVTLAFFASVWLGVSSGALSLWLSPDPGPPGASDPIAIEDLDALVGAAVDARVDFGDNASRG